MSSDSGIVADVAASWASWDAPRKRAHVSVCFGWICGVVALSTTWASYTLVTGTIPALAVSEIDLSLLTGTICGNGGPCQDASTQITNSPLWIAVSDATGHASGAAGAALFRALFALTLVPVVVVSFFEAARWVSVFRLPILPFDIYPIIEPVEWYARCVHVVLALAACIYGAVGLFSNAPVDWTPYSSTAREGFVFAWLSLACYVLGAAYGRGVAFSIHFQSLGPAAAGGGKSSGAGSAGGISSAPLSEPFLTVGAGTASYQQM